MAGLGRDLGMWGWEMGLDDWTSVDDKLRRFMRGLDLDNVHGLRKLLKLHDSFLISFDTFLESS